VAESGPVTVLYASISGYTRAAGEPDDEAAELADAFAAIVRDTLGEFGGLLQVLDGGAICEFGSARQAIRASIALQRDLRSALPVGVGIGLEAEEAALEHAARSAATDSALRLSLVAGPGRVLATETVVHLGRRVAGIDYGAPRRMRVGFKGRTRVYELTSTEPLPPVPIMKGQRAPENRRRLPWRR
jgi:class 3 adenylate cyclase